MLIRGQTTEDRIREIAQGFGQGIENFQQGQDRQRAQTLQDEALKRQQAMQAFEVESKLSDQTGRNMYGSGAGSQVMSGNNGGIGAMLNKAPMTPKYEREQRKLEKEALKNEAEMEKLNYERNERAKDPTERDSFKEKAALLGVKNKNKPVVLPIENKTTIAALAKKNSDATYIANNLDTFLKNAENYTDDQILTQGKQLIKTINSTLGPDATGAEEVKRLASKLEFGLGNFTNDNPTQFGRDLKGFRQQVKDTVDIMRGSVNMNKQEIERQYGRAPVSQPVSTQQAASVNVSPEIAQRVQSYTPAQVEARKAELRARNGSK